MFCHSAHAGREVAIERTCWSRRYIGSKSSNFTQESEACFALVEIGIFHFSQRNVKVFLTDSSSHLLSHVPLSRNFSAPINLWRVGHPRRKPKYLLYYWRFAGALERGEWRPVFDQWVASSARGSGRKTTNRKELWCGSKSLVESHLPWHQDIRRRKQGMACTM